MMSKIGFVVALAAAATVGCGSKDDGSGNHGAGASSTNAGGANTGGGASANGGTSPGSGGSGNGATGGTSGHGGGSSGGSAGMIAGIPAVPGVPCASVDTTLPSKPCMVNVSVKVNGNDADIHFDPIDGAVDYRVYELPDDKDVIVDGDVVSTKNAVYRCAGTRMAAPVAVDGATQIQSGAVRTLVDGQDVNGYTRTLDEATLGYVSAVPGDGLVPVYALGDSGKDADNQCFFMRWNESRLKQYVTSDDDRQSLLAQAFRDDGIVFYVPSGTDGTRPVYTSTDDTARYYFVDGPEAGKRSGATTAFNVYTDPADGLVPLMRVYYQNGCGRSHDELVAGQARFDRARNQGATSPMNDLHWSGLTGETTLVVEALADGCPSLPGLLAPVSDGSWTDEYGNVRPPWISFDDAQALSKTGEVYVNGQFDSSNKPRPIARAFVKVKPAAAPDFDWFEGFDTEDSIGTLTDEDCGNPINCTGEFRQAAAFGDVHFLSAEDRRHVLQSMFGELWVMYDDVAADTPGKFRLTAGKTATIADDTFLYATMDVNAFTTARRYPQIIVSDQQPPVQWNLTKGKTVIFQTFGEWPPVLEIEVCDHRTWDVNNQCPSMDLYHYYSDGSTDDLKSIAPNAEVGEHTGVDRNTHFEVWVSSKRAYIYLDGEPYGCADLPSGVPSAGDATVTFGDTLYHSGVDELQWYSYMQNYQRDTERHYDNLGFKSGVAAPDWDESRLPCVSTISE